ncbi:MAG: hypothetical protein JST25_01530, partial [Actinobacteria bacterium]|nr:hypothetical protein [Actinomycetota bacterium]
MTERSRGVAVARAHRVIRVLAEGEGPFPGELVTCADGVAVRVSAPRLRGWRGWALAGAEHVAAPLDVLLGAEGQDALLPWCVRTVGVHLAGLGGPESGGMSRGEAVTLAVSLLRGVVELTPEDAGSASGVSSADIAEAEPCGAWWLTDEGRPVFAIDAAAAPGEDGTACATAERALRDLESRVEDRALQRVLLRLADALRDPRRLRAEAARWEQELLEIAAPRPLRLSADTGAEPDGAEGAATVPHRLPQPLRRRDLRMGERRMGERRMGERRGNQRRTDRASAPIRARRERWAMIAQGAAAARDTLAVRFGRFAGGFSVSRSRLMPPEPTGRRRRWAG